MACAAPLTLYGPPVPRTSAREACQRQLARRLSTIVMRSMNLSDPKYVLTVTSHRFCSKSLSRTFCFQPTVVQFSGRCNTHAVMTGFWVGPDNEDGWGFVQAFVQQT